MWSILRGMARRDRPDRSQHVVATRTDDDRATPRRRPVGSWGPVLLVRAAHPRQTVLTAVGVTAAAALADRPARELLLVLGTVLVGQALAGWHNDVVDRSRDRADERTGKPLVGSDLDPGTVWFAIACAVLLVVPLALSAGLRAGVAYLLVVVLSLVANLVLRHTWLSWVPWAASFALYPAYLSYGGWGGSHVGEAPEIAMTAIAAALGVCVHVLRALPGLVADNRAGRRHLPLRIALRTGAPRLLWLTLVVTAAVVAALVVVGSRVGLAQ